MPNFWSVPPLWAGETCAILASGPSLLDWWQDPSKAEGALRGKCRVITINDWWPHAPWADAHYFCDQKWWTPEFRKHGEKMTQGPGIWIQGVQREAEMAQYLAIYTLRLTGQRGFDPNTACLRHGSNSGYQAIHLATHFGSKRILLLGYDMKVLPNRSHCHNGERPRDFGGIIKRSFLPHFPTLVEPLKQRGVEVINCTPGSALTCWPTSTLEESLSRISRVA